MQKFLTQPQLETIMIDLETPIMNCWSMVDDLDYVLEQVQDNDVASNMLIGIKALYQAKFERLWEVFEASI